MASVFRAGPVEARPIRAEDAGALQRLLESCEDYTLLVEGQAPDSEAALDLMSEVAPGKTLRDKTLLGLYAADGTLAGVLDVIHDYPVPGEWFLGLLLLDPQWRGQGLGTAVVRAAEAWAAQGGARAIGLGVVEVNVDALRFWQRLGYAEVSRTARRPFGQREHVVIVLRRTLDT